MSGHHEYNEGWHHHHHIGPFGKKIFGTNSDDDIFGSNHSETIFGLRGNDLIYGGFGNDAVYGGRGDDLIDGGKGNDRLFGERGNDALVGGDGNDDLYGGSGRDLLLGGAGSDDLSGDWGNDKFLFRKGMGVDTIEHLDAGDRIDVRDFNIASFQALINSAQQVGHNVQISLGNGDKLVIEDTRISNLHAEQFIISNEVKGPSSSQNPYLLSSNSHVYTESLLTAGDSVGGYKMEGIPDGLGAFDNGDGTFTVLMNHEIECRRLGVPRADGGNGAFVSEWVFDKTTLQVLSGKDLVHDVWLYDTTTQSYVDHNAANNPVSFSRFCSADLADQERLLQCEHRPWLQRRKAIPQWRRDGRRRPGSRPHRGRSSGRQQLRTRLAWQHGLRKRRRQRAYRRQDGGRLDGRRTERPGLFLCRRQESDRQRHRPGRSDWRSSARYSCDRAGRGDQQQRAEHRRPARRG